MTKIILADVQPIYRAGIARVLSNEPDLHIVAQCSDMERTLHAVTTFPASLVLFSSALQPEWQRFTLLLETMGSRGIVIADTPARMLRYEGSPQATVLTSHGRGHRGGPSEERWMRLRCFQR